MADGEKVGGIDRKWWYVIGAVVAVGGYFLYKWYQNNQANAAANAANTALSNEPSGAQTASTDLSPSTTGSAATSTISTLSDWMTQAQSWLTSSINADPASVQEALQNYANGTCLTDQQYQYIDQALGQLGMPPDAPYQGLIKCPNAPSPPPPPTTTPPPSKFPYSRIFAITSTAQANQLKAEGYYILQMATGMYDSSGKPITSPTGLWYYADQPGSQGITNLTLNHITTQAEAVTLKAHGYQIYTVANMLFYNPLQKVKSPYRIPTG